MALFLNVIGILEGVPSVVSFISGLLAPHQEDATTVRVVLGSNVNESESLGGNRPGASLWDFNGNAIGFERGTKDIVPQGNFVDIKVAPRAQAGNIQAEYVSISNGGDDAICIAGVALTFPDGAKAGFSTNIAAACGALWSNSETPVVNTAADGLDNPKCVWIDRDGSNGIPHQGMGIHLPSFSNTNENLGTSYSHNNDLMCKSGPRFRMYPQLTTESSILVFQHPPRFITDSDDSSLIGTDEDPGFIIENPGILAGKLRKRAAGAGNQRRYIKQYNCQNASATFNNTIGINSTAESPLASQRPMAERVIISPHSYNSARELCESHNSWGHSFVSLPESLFCDMTDKMLYYTCSNKIGNCCFDTEMASFRGCQRSSRIPPVEKLNSTSVHPAALRPRQANGGSTPPWMKGDKTYDSVQRW